jgi:CRP-like cAMP-binding protein
MPPTLILQNIARHITLSAAEERGFVSLLQPRSYKRKEFMLHEREVCHFSAFVLSGCLRSYNIDHNGFEHVLQFAPSGWWITDLAGMLSGKPGNLNIDALEDSETVLFPLAEREKLFADVPKFERFFRILAENALVASRQRLLDGMSLTAQERYELFCKRYPTLIETLPQKQVAAYIGVTPEFLSKMKAELLKGKKHA